MGCNNKKEDRPEGISWLEGMLVWGRYGRVFHDEQVKGTAVIMCECRRISLSSRDRGNLQPDC